MTFNMQSIVRSKSEMRRKLAALPIEEKLTMLDALRERHLALQNAEPRQSVSGAHLVLAQAALKN